MLLLLVFFALLPTIKKATPPKMMEGTDHDDSAAGPSISQSGANCELLKEVVFQENNAKK
jgi:hypothetical protein